MMNAIKKWFCLVLVSVLVLSAAAVSFAETAEETEQAAAAESTETAAESTEAAAESAESEESNPAEAPDVQVVQFDMTSQFINFTDTEWYYSGIVETDGLKYETIYAPCQSEYFPQYNCIISFDQENKTAYVSAAGFVTVAADKNTVLDTLNQLNVKQDFVKFAYVEDAGSVLAEISVYVGDNPCEMNVLYPVYILLNVLETQEIAESLLALQ